MNEPTQEDLARDADDDIDLEDLAYTALPAWIRRAVAAEAEVERLRALLTDGYDGGPASCKYCGKVTEHWEQTDDFTPAAFACHHCGKVLSGSMLAAHRCCTWNHPEQPTCPEPANGPDGLCQKHRGLVHYLRDNPPPLSSTEQH